MTNDQLKKKRTATLLKMAKEAKIKGAAKLDRKGLLEALSSAPIKEKVEKVKEEAPVEEPKVEEPKEKAIEAVKKEVPGFQGSRAAARSKAMRMKEKLAAQPKVRILIPRGQGERAGATMPVTLNGYRMNILKGVYVDVPQQVGDVIMESQQQTVMADSEFKRKEDGKPMRIDGSESQF